MIHKQLKIGGLSWVLPKTKSLNLNVKSGQRLRAGLLCSAMCAVALPASLNAQDTVVEEVVVKGFRLSLENAISNKREAATVIESISAEDIGKLPDISVADSIARLPGVTAQRTGGQAGAINIRGLDENLILATLNGREQVATGGGRSIDFSQYPSELVSGVDVYKSPEARLIEGGVGGTVALKLARPLSGSIEKEHSFNLNARLSYNDLAGDTFDASETGHRFSFSYTGIFADETLGVVLGYAGLEQPNVEARFSSDVFNQSRDVDDDGTDDILAPRYGAEELGGDDSRDGYIASIQWQPTDDFELTFDSYYSKFESDGFARGVTVLGPQAAGSIANPMVSNGVVTGGTFTRTAASPITDPDNPFTQGACCGGFDITPSSDTQTRGFEDKLLTLGLGLEWVSDAWTFTGDVAYSQSDSFRPDERVIINLLDNAFQLDTSDIQFQLLQDGLNVPSVFTFSNNFGDDPSQLFVGSYAANPTANEDELFALSADAKYDFDSEGIESLQLGVRTSNRDAAQIRNAFSVGNTGGFFQFAQNNSGDGPANPFANSIPGFSPVFVPASLYSVENFNGDFTGFPSFLAIDFDGVTGLFPDELVATQVPGRRTAEFDPPAGNFAITESFEIEEDTNAFYVQANYNFEFLGMPVRGNLGFRYVDTEVSSSGATILDGQVLPIEIENGYTEVLPSFNANFEPTDNDIVRVALSKVLARPDLTDLAASNSVGISNDGTTARPSGSGGNTNLNPFLANQFDLSYEHYTESGGIYTVAFFYKDVETFVFSQTRQLDFVAEGFINPDTVSLMPGLVFDPSGEFTAPANGDGGSIRGIEFALTQTFDDLPWPFNGLGVTANYSYTDSSVTLPSDNPSQTATDISLPGLSENVLNATLFYQQDGFETRIGYRFRDEFVSRQQGIGVQTPITAAESIVDFQASYAFSDDSNLSGLNLLFQINNLTDEKFSTYFGQEEALFSTSFFGRQVFLGASYSF